MQLAFYKANTGKAYQKLIAWITRPGPYCHVEVVFNGWREEWLYTNAMNVQKHDPKPPAKLCFSASEQDKGTRFKEINLTDGHWDVVDVRCSQMSALAFCVPLVGTPSDFWGLRGFLVHKDLGNRKKLWCSEVAAKVLKDQGVLPNGFDTQCSPNELARAVGLLR